MATAAVRWVTIIDVMRAMGVEPTKRLNWNVGRDMARYHKQRFGVLPPKDNRPKTSGTGGQHCFALYPISMIKKICEFIRKYRSEAKNIPDPKM